jgi:hypothetical protein
VAVAHALHAATHGLAGAGVQDKAAGCCCQWTDCSEALLRCVALRCAASGGAGSSVVSGVVSLQRAPVVRHDRRAGQWARDALVKLQPAWSLDAGNRQARRGASEVMAMAGAGATPTGKKLAMIRFGNGGWQRANRRGRWQVKHK